MPVERGVQTGPIHIHFESKKTVLVERENEDRFMLTAKEAARACAMARSEAELREQFSDVLVFLREWCERHSEKVVGVFVYPSDGCLNILLLTPSTTYDMDFDDAVTDLDLALVERFDWLTAEVIQRPRPPERGTHPYRKRSASMATEAAHNQQATCNQSFLDTIDATQFPDWAVTVAFYKAVHLVEAMLKRRGIASGPHTIRNGILKRQFAAVWRHYRPLYNQSRTARYLCVPMRAADVVRSLHRLADVESSAGAIV